MNTVIFYDTKPYDREFFERAPEAHWLQRQFHKFRLTSETAASVDGAQAVCVVVNDRLDAPCLKQLYEVSVGLVALRCAARVSTPLTSLPRSHSGSPERARVTTANLLPGMGEAFLARSLLQNHV